MLCRVSLYFPLVEYHAGSRALYSCSLIKSIWLSWLLFESSISCPVQWPPVLHPVGTWMEKEHTVFFLKPLSPLLLVSPDLRLSWSRRDLTEKDSKIFLKKKNLKAGAVTALYVLRATGAQCWSSWHTHESSPSPAQGATPSPSCLRQRKFSGWLLSAFSSTNPYLLVSPLLVRELVYSELMRLKRSPPSHMSFWDPGIARNHSELFRFSFRGETRLQLGRISVFTFPVENLKRFPRKRPESPSFLVICCDVFSHWK